MPKFFKAKSKNIETIILMLKSNDISDIELGIEYYNQLSIKNKKIILEKIKSKVAGINKYPEEWNTNGIAKGLSRSIVIENKMHMFVLSEPNTSKYWAYVGP